MATPKWTPGGVVVPVEAGAQPATNQQQADAAQALVDLHGDKNPPAEKPQKKRKTGRPKADNAMTENLHAILCNTRLKQIIAALAAEWDRPEAWVMRKLMSEAGENHIIKNDLQHKLEH
ncbi:MAG: hypothetical protein RPT25_09375 [Cycloclasticus sp.]